MSLFNKAPKYTPAYSPLIDAIGHDKRQATFAFDGAACLANACIFDLQLQGSFVFAIDEDRKTLELVDTVGSEKVHEVCAVLPPTTCRYFVFRREESRGMRRRHKVVVVAWLPQQAELKERVLYKEYMKDLCCQLRRVDHTFEIYN
ncbi:hypothetical protein FBU31_001307 [Coemansia sp. 'formosensis']|nr:hypothetical protein FBU31_001307 [Coemansia sp. 'formosensis']